MSVSATVPVKLNTQTLSAGLSLLILPVLVICIRPLLAADLSFYLRLMAALGGALIGANLPGMINVEFRYAKATSALGVFLVIFLVNPPQAANNKFIESENIKWAENLTLPTKETPEKFPRRFTYKTDKSSGWFTYVPQTQTWIEYTTIPGVPHFVFRTVAVDKDSITILDDSRKIAIKLPASGGMSYLSGAGLNGNFTKFYKLEIARQA